MLFMYFMKVFKHCISDFLSELGIEKEDEEEDSPWDSEVSIMALVSLAAKIVCAPVCKPIHVLELVFLVSS